LFIDFEDGDLASWRPRDGDVRYIEYAILDRAPAGGGNWLSCRVRGWGDEPPGNEQIILRRVFDEPITIMPGMVFSWKWWIGDRRDNDGVGIRLCMANPTEGAQRAYGRVSHSNRARGLWPYTDPVRCVCQHTVDLERQIEIDREQCAANLTDLPWTVNAIEIYFWFPYRQDAYFDEIYIGPPDAKRNPDEPHIFQRSQHTMTPNLISLLVGDVDGDGRLDQIAGCEDEAPLLLLADEGSPWDQSTSHGHGLDSAISMLEPRLHDFNEDGILDLIGLSRTAVVICCGLGSARFREAVVLRPSDLEWNAPAGFLAADLLPPRGPELLVRRYNGVNHDSLYTHLMSGMRTARAVTRPTDGRTRRGYRTAAVAGDVDGDHDLDLFCTNSDLYLCENDSLVCRTTEWLPEIGNHQVGAVFGDVDNDMDLDLFIAVDIKHDIPAAHVSHRHSLLYRNDGNRFVDVSDWLGETSTEHVHSPILADFDLDGDLDLLLGQQSWQSHTDWLPNIYLVNDGTGHFTTGAPDSWIPGPTAARDWVCADADRDGDPDLLMIQRGDGQLIRVLNSTDRKGVVVRVLDSNGLPHASGAAIALFDGVRCIGYRQTGTGNLNGGWSEAIFGCPTDGPFDLQVTFPSLPEEPVIRRGVRPGMRLLIVEPCGSGLLGGLRSRANIGARRLSQALAATGWSVLLAGGVLYGSLLGATLYGLRNRFLTTREPRSREERQGRVPARNSSGVAVRGLGGRLGPRIRTAVLLVTLALLGVLLVAAPRWPQYADAIVAGWLGLGGLVLGAGAGFGVAYLDSSRRRALGVPQLDTASVRVQLLDAIDGFSHAGWIKYLSGIATLCTGLLEGGDPQPIRQRLARRLHSYRHSIRPQIQQISELLPHSGFDADLVSTFIDDAATIDAGLDAVSQWIAGRTDARSMLNPLSTAAVRMHATVDRIFREMGKHFSADLKAELESAIDRVDEMALGVPVAFQIPRDLPTVFSLRGELSNIFENLITNGARAALSNTRCRFPHVEILVHREGDLLFVTFKDNGSGIPMERLDTLFDQRKTRARCRGRGLPYAKRRLRLFDGKIDIVNSTPGGTAVVVTLRAIGALETAETPQRVSHVHSLSKGALAEDDAGRTLDGKTEEEPSISL
jgi:hypothetical protein